MWTDTEILEVLTTPITPMDKEMITRWLPALAIRQSDIDVLAKMKRNTPRPAKSTLDRWKKPKRKPVVKTRRWKYNDEQFAVIATFLHKYTDQIRQVCDELQLETDVKRWERMGR